MMRSDRFNIVQDLNDKIREARLALHYAQGATNIYTITAYDNAQTSAPLNMRFFVASEFPRINSVKLSYQIRPYREMGTTGPTEAGIPGGSIVVKAGLDGGALSLVGSPSISDGGGQTNKDISSFITAVGSWYNVQFTPGSNVRVRIEANVIVKTFTS